MICPFCHTDNRADAKFCNECGFDLRSLDESTAEETDAPTPPEVIDEALNEVKSLGDVLPPIVKVPAIEEGEDEDESLEKTCVLPDEAVEVVSAAAPDDAPSAEPDSVYAEAQAMFGGKAAPDAEVTADLRGLERLVDSSYVPPVVSGRVGDTMQLPRIEDDITPRSQSFRAQVDRKELRRQKKEQRKLEREQRKRARELQRQGATPVSPASSGALDDEPAHEPHSAEASGAFSTASPDVMVARDEAPRSSRKGPIIGLIALVAVLCVAIAGGTYYMEMWGGKTVPSVAGESLADARSILEDKGFATVVEEVKSDDVEGLVIDTDPAAGSRAEEGSQVAIRVATARIVPDVEGKTQAEVERLMAEEGLTNGTYELVKSNETEGTALDVEPAAGERAKADDAIVVSIAQSYVVPDVAGKTTEEATSLLEAEGYVVTVTQRNTEDYAEGTALSTDPAAGTKHPTGSAVTLYVAHNRSTELVDLTRAFFNGSSLMTIGGVVYRLDATSLQLSYAGSNTVNFTVSGTEVGFIFGIAVDNPSGPQSLSGSVTWDDDNNIVSTYPVMQQGA